MSDFLDLDHYELLGIAPAATQDEIKRAYRREIAKYHPDRFVNANADEQAYAQRRSQALTEAYATLSNFRTRSLYNAGLKTMGGSAAAQRPSAPPQRQPGQTPQRDHQAELYDQAVAHLQAGHTLQAIAALRQLQQINPFYRDSAALLEQAEAQGHAPQHSAPKQPAAEKPNSRRTFLIAGGVGGLAVLGLAAWALTQRGGQATLAGQPDAPGAQLPTAANTAEPSPTAAATAGPTSAPTAAATARPTAAPTAAATQPPTEVPTEVPTDTPTALPAEQGQLLFSDSFASAGWADQSGAGWSVGYAQGGRYRIAVNAGIGMIWSYRTLQPGQHSLGVDVQVAQSEGGMLLSFVDEDNFVSFVVNPAQSSYRLERRGSQAAEVLAGGQSDAILGGANDTNRLLARVSSSTVQLVINGQQVASIDTPADILGSNRFGLIAVSGRSDAEVFFDNLEVRALQ